MEDFFRNDDLLYCLGENASHLALIRFCQVSLQNTDHADYYAQITSLKLLRNLCLTSKLFNATFTPFLYKKLAIRSFDFEQGDRNGRFEFDMDQNPNLKHTRYLVLPDILSDSSSSKRLDAYRRLWGRMPALEHLEIQRQGRNNDLFTWLMIDKPDLKTLEYSFCDHNTLPCSMKPPPGEEWRFKRLRRLDLSGLTPRTLASSTLASLLVSNTQLEELALSTPHESGSSYLYDLCESFQTQGGKPLKIWNLSIGPGMGLYGDEDREFFVQAAAGRIDLGLLTETVTPAGYLEKLCDLSVLEQVTLHHPRLYPPYPDPLGIPFSGRHPALSTFTKQRAPRLRRLWIQHDRDDSHLYGWIKAEVATPTGYDGQLALCLAPLYPEGKMKLDCIGLPWKPRELHVGLNFAGPRPLAITGSDTWPYILAYADSLEALEIMPPIELDEASCEIYANLICQLPHLRAFKLQRCEFLRPSPDCRFLRPNPRLLDRLVRKGPTSLRYLKVDVHAWRVVRDPITRLAVRLEGMDAWEQVEVDLFVWIPFYSRHNDVYREMEGDEPLLEENWVPNWKEVYDFDLPLDENDGATRVSGPLNGSGSFDE